MKKKRMIALIALGAALLIFAAVLVVLNVTKPAEEQKTPPTLLPEELLGENDPGERIEKDAYLLMFPRRDRSSVKTIAIHNGYGDYTLVRYSDETFYLAELPGAPLIDEAVASAVVASGYVLTTDRIVDSATDEQLAEYGLDDPQAWWVLTDTAGKEYRVNVGDRMVSGDGYYCAFEGRGAVYTLSSSLESSIMMPCEHYVTAAMTSGVTQNNYFDIEEFTILRGSEPFVSVMQCEPEEKLNPDAIVEAKLAYPSGYRANDSFYIGVISGFVSFAGDETAAIAKSEEDYERFGLKDAPYAVHFALEGKDYDMFFSEVREDGYVYGISNLFDYKLIARFKGDSMSWLRAGLFNWVADYPLQINITTVSSLRVRTEDRDVTFELKHGTDEKENATLDVTSDVVSFDNAHIYNFRQFYKTVIGSKIKGDSSLTEDERAALAADESRAIFRVTFNTTDGKEIEYGFYRATTREALLTVNGKGDFYINIDWAEKLVSDLERLIAGLDIDSYGKD
ncbi:MAG: DUF4340 domain-containing protein [Clostridia bacterium]|nr:DUF4340 domain-containing protein [Clostridia bacterium]MBR3640391.1 DUF4340 domain-containing protein [Clostridia bacterium]